MITTTVGKIADAYATLLQLANLPVDGDVAMVISINMSRMKDTIEAFDKSRQPLVDDLLILNPDGSVKAFKDRQKWDAEIEKLISLKVDLSVMMFEVSQIKGIHGITGNQISMIDWLINFPKEEEPIASNPG